jgi:hypothetical protein
MRLEAVNYDSLMAMKNIQGQVLVKSFKTLQGVAWPVSIILILSLAAYVQSMSLVLFLALPIAVFYGFYLDTIISDRKDKMWEHFAAANNWQYDASAASLDNIPPSYNYGTDGGMSTVVMALINNIPMNIFSFTRLNEINGKGLPHDYTAVRVPLPAAVPHIVLFNDHTHMRVQTGFDQAQKVQLEGNFNSYFTMEIEAGTQVDALTIITPDVMQVMIADESHEDIEIAGRALYFVVASDKRDALTVKQLLTSAAALTPQIIENLNSSIFQNDK